MKSVTKARESGTMTLEAAIMVPMFIIIMLFINGLFVLFMGQQVMMHSLVQSTKSLAYDPYSSQRAEGNTNDHLVDMFCDIVSIAHGKYISNESWYTKDSAEVCETVKDRFMAYLADSASKADDALKTVGVKNGSAGLDFSGSSYDKDTGILTVDLKYVQTFLFDVLDVGSMDRNITFKMKLFEYHK